ncbi:MAG: AAA family ATPase [Candidatus Caldatribacteriota bacterium]|nr:AAA family ATPase [Candidatus Caldatribacteriota bacterium]
MSIKIRTFGIPAVIGDNGNRILFPYTKLEALFYYIVINKKATRDELADLLWGNCNEKYAKKNLRNAIYNISKLFKKDIFISPKRTFLALNPKLEIKLDLDIFLQDNIVGINVYAGEFLKGFFVKQAERFEEWMVERKRHYHELYIRKLYFQLNKNFKEKSYNNTEYYAKLIIKADKFDENAYRLLIKTYLNKGDYTKAIKVYNELLKFLKKELNIEPDTNTKILINKVLKLRNIDKKQESFFYKKYFYGREKELSFIFSEYKKFINNKDYRSIILFGEAGVGKTGLIQEFNNLIKNDKVSVFKTNCYQTEENYILKAWNNIFSMIPNNILATIKYPKSSVISNLFPIFPHNKKEGLSNNSTKLIKKLTYFKYQKLEEEIIKILNKISRQNKIILIFEDIHWIDIKSLSLLAHVLLYYKKNNIFFILSCRNEKIEKINKFLSLIIRYNKYLKISINRFNKEETKSFIQYVLPEYRLSPVSFSKIFQETEGLPLFIVEVIEAIKANKEIGTIFTHKIQDILESRFFKISEKEKNILNIISLFFNGVNLKLLKKITGEEELKIMNVIENLENKFLIKEIDSPQGVIFKFTHQKLREFVYLKQPLIKRKVLHNRIGVIIKDSLKNKKNINIQIYSSLIYHFENAGNIILALKYSIKYIEFYLDFAHELFPTITKVKVRMGRELFFKKREITNYFEEINKLLKAGEKKYGLITDILKFKVYYYHIVGRYYIREGFYDKGIKFIYSMIRHAESINDYRYILKGFRQIIYYCIQIHDCELMKKYVEKGLLLSKKHHYRDETAFFLRLKGLNKIMIADYEEGEKYLNRSIEILQQLSHSEIKYLLNIAGAYNYLGDIKRYNMKPYDSLFYYKKAIAICKNKNLNKSLALIYTRIGKSYFDMSNYDKAKDYFEEAIFLYRKFNSFWGRSISNGYLSLIYTKEGKYLKAYNALKSADKFCQKIKSPYELGLIYRIKAEIKREMKFNKLLRKVFEKYLIFDVKDYCKQGIEKLAAIKEAYEKNILVEILKNN